MIYFKVQSILYQAKDPQKCFLYDIVLGCDELPKPVINGMFNKILNDIVEITEPKNDENELITPPTKHGKQSKYMILVHMKGLLYGTVFETNSINM